MKFIIRAISEARCSGPPAYSFSCPLCHNFDLLPDMMYDYIAGKAEKHLVRDHRVGRKVKFKQKKVEC